MWGVGGVWWVVCGWGVGVRAMVRAGPPARRAFIYLYAGRASDERRANAAFSVPYKARQRLATVQYTTELLCTVLYSILVLYEYSCSVSVDSTLTQTTHIVVRTTSVKKFNLSAAYF